MNENIIALIMARGGSKGVPKKNIRNLGGFPLIAYSIVACKLTKSISRVIVSTDSEEIANIAKQFGAEVPFSRPEQYARDNSTDKEVIDHALYWLKKNEGVTPDYLLQIRPTTPFREPEVIEKAITTIILHDDDYSTSLISVHKIEEGPGKMFVLEDEFLRGLCPLDPRKEYFNLPRQAFPDTYMGGGYIDIIKPKTINKYDSLYGPRMLGFIVPNEHEVDCEEDFKRLEYIITTEKVPIYEIMKKEYSNLKNDKC